MSFQWFEFIHLKNQRANNETKPENSDDDSEGETEEGDYTVYECPGLAPVSYLFKKLLKKNLIY